MKIKTFFYLASLLIVLTFNAKSQVSVSNVSDIPRIKKGTTYIVMKNPESVKSKEFKDIFQKYWTYSKFEFIKFADIDKYYSEESSFLDIRGYTSTAFFQNATERTNKPSYRSNDQYSNTHFYLELWVCNEKCLKSKKKNPMDLDYYKQFIVKIELGTDQDVITKPDNLYQSDYDGQEHIQNWGPGILKNYIQLISIMLDKGEELKYDDDICNNDAIKILKTKTLYVPDYVLLKYGYNPIDHRNVRDEEEVFGDYNYKYKVITKDELNRKILTETEPIYYLLYTLGSGDKYVTVVNSSTGEFIYSDASIGYYKFKQGDMKDIQKAVLGK